MSTQKSIVAVALLSTAASAEAGLTSAIPEPAAVTLIFVALAVAGVAATRWLARRRETATND